MGSAVYGSVLYRGTGRVCAQKVITLPIFCRPYGARAKATAAIGTNVAEDIADARFAKGAFVSANPGFERVGRQRFITVFACWSKFKHDPSSPCNLLSHFLNAAYAIYLYYLYYKFLVTLLRLTAYGSVVQGGPDP